MNIFVNSVSKIIVLSCLCLAMVLAIGLSCYASDQYTSDLTKQTMEASVQDLKAKYTWFTGCSLVKVDEINEGDLAGVVGGWGCSGQQEGNAKTLSLMVWYYDTASEAEANWGKFLPSGFNWVSRSFKEQYTGAWAYYILSEGEDFESRHIIFRWRIDEFIFHISVNSDDPVSQAWMESSASDIADVLYDNAQEYRLFERPTEFSAKLTVGEMNLDGERQVVLELSPKYYTYEQETLEIAFEYIAPIIFEVDLPYKIAEGQPPVVYPDQNGIASTIIKFDPEEAIEEGTVIEARAVHPIGVTMTAGRMDSYGIKTTAAEIGAFVVSGIVTDGVTRMPVTNISIGYLVLGDSKYLPLYGGNGTHLWRVFTTLKTDADGRFSFHVNQPCEVLISTVFYIPEYNGFTEKFDAPNQSADITLIPNSSGASSSTLLLAHGSVEIRDSINGEWRTANEGDPIFAGMAIRTLDNAHARIYVAGKGIVHMTPYAEFHLERAQQDKTILQLIKGLFCIDTEPNDHGFELKTSAATTNTRGTNFRYEVTPEGDIIEVTEGSLEMYPNASPDTSVFVNVGHRLTILGAETSLERLDDSEFAEIAEELAALGDSYDENAEYIIDQVLLPNLAMTNIRYAGSTITEGEVFTVEVDISNIGAGEAFSSHAKLHLSTDKSFGGDYEIPQILVVPPLLPGESVRIKWDFVVPDLLDTDTYTAWLFCTADSAEEVFEATGGNTWRGVDSLTVINAASPKGTISSVHISSGSLPADGESTATVTATVRDSSGTPLAGQNIQMAMSDGQGTIGSVIDNGDGTYTATYTASDQAGTESITITLAENSKVVEIVLTTVEPSIDKVLSITSAEAAPGDSIVVHVSINDATGMASGDVLLKYDANVLSVDDVKNADLISGMGFVVNQNVSGEIRFSMASGEGLTSGSGPLVDIEMTVSPNAQTDTETALSFEDTEIYNELGEVIPAIMENGTVSIKQQGIKGDVNGDGRIRSNDATLALRIAAQLMTPNAYQSWAADMNGDGKIRANDATLILREAAGLTGQ